MAGIRWALMSLVLGLAWPALAQSEVSPNASYKLSNQHSGKFLAVAGGSTSDGAAVVQWADQGQGDIVWRLMPGEAGTYLLRNSRSGLVLTVEGASAADGAKLVQAREPRVGKGRGAALWSLEPVGTDRYRIVNDLSGLYLAVAGASGADGAAIVLWHDFGQEDLVWQLVPATEQVAGGSEKTAGAKPPAAARMAVPADTSRLAGVILALAQKNPCEECTDIFVDAWDAACEYYPDCEACPLDTSSAAESECVGGAREASENALEAGTCDEGVWDQILIICG